MLQLCHNCRGRIQGQLKVSVQDPAHCEAVQPDHILAPHHNTSGSSHTTHAVATSVPSSEAVDLSSVHSTHCEASGHLHRHRADVFTVAAPAKAGRDVPGLEPVSSSSAKAQPHCGYSTVHDDHSMSDHPTVPAGQNMSAAEPRVTLRTQMQQLSELSDLLSHRLQLSEAAAVGPSVEDSPCLANLLPAAAVRSTEPAANAAGAAAVSPGTVRRRNTALQPQAAALGSADCTAYKLDSGATPAALDTLATDSKHMLNKHRADLAEDLKAASSAGAAGQLCTGPSRSAAASHSKPEAGVEQSETDHHAHQAPARQPAFTVRTVLDEAGHGVPPSGGSRQEQAVLDLQLWGAASDDEGGETGNSQVFQACQCLRDRTELRFVHGSE